MSIFQANKNSSWNKEEYFATQIILISSVALGVFS